MGRLPRVLRSPLGLVLAFLLDIALFGGPHRPDVQAGHSLRAALDAQAVATERFLGAQGVVGTAVGLSATGEHVVKVFLSHPGTLNLPPTLVGVPVEIEVTGPFVALGDAPGSSPASAAPTASAATARVDLPPPPADPAGAPALDWTPPWATPADDDDGDGIDRRATFERPVPIGVSTGHGDVTAGTIGARVTDGVRVYALSNNHVYAAGNGGRRGDPVFQPGMLDGARDPDDALGSLHDFEPIRFCAGPRCPANTIDAALALTTHDDLDRVTPEDGYGAPRPRPADPALGMTVQKYGRTTGWTKGRITGIHATIDVQYRNGIARFEEQVVISGRGAFSNPGDSGSLIVTDGALLGDRRPVALLFAGSSSSTIANPIGPVLDRFGVRVDGAWR